MKRQDKGQIRIIEAFLVLILIFSTFTVFSNLSITVNTKENEDLSSLGMQTLIKLDSDGKLGKFIDDRNWTALRESLDLLFLPSVCFNLTVYDDQMNQLNNVTISNGVWNSHEVAFIEYICISRNKIFHCYILHLRLTVIR